MRFKLAAGLGEPWCRDGGIPQGCPLSMFLLLLFMFPGADILSHYLMLNLNSMLIILNVVLFVPGLYLSLLTSLLGMSGSLVKMSPLASVFFLVLPKRFVGP